MENSAKGRRQSMRYAFKNLFGEPLVHFIALAGMLFLAQALWPKDDREVILLDAATQDFLVEERAKLLLRPLGDAEKKQVVHAYIEDELLVREARRRGYNNSSRVRRLLVQNMRYLLASETKPPSEEELRAFFIVNADRFENAATITYDQVMFKDVTAVPGNVLTILNDGFNPAVTDSASSSIRRHLSGVTQKMLAEVFGPAKTRKILAIKDGVWGGPFTIASGTYYVRITNREPANRPKFEVARGWVENEWQVSRQRTALDAELAKIRQNYRIEIEQSGADRT
jgi:hypothetical protein